MAEVLAVVALLVAAWAVVRVEQISRRMKRAEVVAQQRFEFAFATRNMVLDIEHKLFVPLENLLAALEARLASLETHAAERDKVWQSIVTVEHDQPWIDSLTGVDRSWPPPVLRTPTGPKPEVRNVDE